MRGRRRQYLCMSLVAVLILLSIAAGLGAGATVGEEAAPSETPVPVEEPTYQIIDPGDLLDALNAPPDTLDVAAYASGDVEYNVGTSNLDLFRRCLKFVGLGEHYVYYRPGQYQYRMYYGGLSYNGVFSGADIKYVEYYTYSSSGNLPEWRTGTVSSFRFDPGNALVYSDLGAYPPLEERGSDYEILACIILSSFALFYLFNRLRASSRGRI